jgi:hypothetical protein
MARIRFPAVSRDFSLLHSVQPALDPIQPPIKWTLVPLSPGIKRLGREADHLPSSAAEVGAPIRFHGVVLN